MELDDLAPLDRRERQPAEGWQDVIVEYAADTPLGPRLEPHRDMLFEISLGQVGHRRAAVEPGRQRQGPEELIATSAPQRISRRHWPGMRMLVEGMVSIPVQVACIG